MKYKLTLYIIINIILLILCFLLLPSYKSNSTKKYILKGATFDLDVIVLVTEDTANCANYIRKAYNIDVTGEDFDARGLTLPTNGDYPVIVWLPNLDDNTTTGHELLHATINILSWAGVPLNESTEEVYCYQLQYLLTQLSAQKNKGETF